MTRSRRTADDELPALLSDADLLAWGQSLVEDAAPDELFRSDAAAAVLDLRSGASSSPEPPEPVELEPVDVVAVVEVEPEPVQVAAPAPPMANRVLRADATPHVPAAPPAPEARISLRRRELVALRRSLAATAAARSERTPAGRREPLRGYRPAPAAADEGRGSLQARLARSTPVARLHAGQWAAGSDAAAADAHRAAGAIRVRLADAD